MKKHLLILALITTMPLHAAEQAAAAKTLTIDLRLLDDDKAIGSVVVSESPYGLVFTPQLHDLPPGLHGFHIHENPNCAAAEKDGKTVPGLAAGGHWNPRHAEHHGQPWEDTAHLGDLPALYVDNDGKATMPVLAPRLKNVDDIKGHALMVHVGGDNYAEHPAPLGGGGARLACGVIE